MNDQLEIVGIIFDFFKLEDILKEMKEFFEWVEEVFRNEIIYFLLVLVNFFFEFLFIYFFKDGNGRVSRVLINLVLFKQGYGFSKYVVYEKLIEEIKIDYYMVFRKVINIWKIGKEDIIYWFFYFLKILDI